MKRATQLIFTAFYHPKYFNPRPREEGDAYHATTPPISKISIHALVKRATKVYQHIFILLVISIHALVKRATGVPIVASTVADFNPRPREEGDAHILNISYKSINFNPRPREEGDAYHATTPPISKISIHALVKRATACVISACS